MLRRWFPLGGATLFALLLSCGPVAAQALEPGPSANQPTRGRPFYSSSGPGYSTYASEASRPGHTFYPGYYSGDARPDWWIRSNTGYYSSLPPSYLPIMMTTINYPGVYGSHAMGISPYAYNITPTVGTSPHNPPSEGPIGSTYTPSERLTEAHRPALIDVHVPEDAVVEFNGTPTTQTGALRQFESPPLAPGRTYNYEVRAAWITDDGRQETRTRRVRVEPGQRAEVSFTTGRPTENVQTELQGGVGPLPDARKAGPGSPDPLGNERMGR